MTISAAQFRLDFPEFSDVTLYPDTQYAFWYGVSAKMMDATRWGELLDAGSELFVAHQLVLSARAAAEAVNGTPPGTQVGPIGSQSVDKVSISFDNASGVEADGGHWNMTSYGTRYLRLAKMIGVGAIQIGASDYYNDPLSSVNAWPGVIYALTN